ncbi:MAG TPA: aminoglycoside phosphotransferase family protein [Candidatus Limnocylindria bacterium]|nr:aminoglycoside phosphotransferase family protein [Candidatus Limnocylindria bacterium]
MLDDPGLDPRELTAALSTGYGIEATAFAFVPGYDQRAASYAVTAIDGRWFAKVRFGAAPAVPLEVPRALLDAGVPNVLAPIHTRAGSLLHPMAGDRSLVAYPFATGRSAMEAGMTRDQWRTFGTTLLAVHDSGIDTVFAGRLPDQAFALPSAGEVRGVLSGLGTPRSGAAAERLDEVLRNQTERIGSMLDRAEALAAVLRSRPFERVLCHADIHAANVLVTEDGGILLVDWDGPMLAPRERDLLFVIGSRIARAVEPHEQSWFFEGYGTVRVDPEALIFFRYERILEDIAEIGRSVFDVPGASEGSRAGEVRLLEGFFTPDALEAIERV